MPITPKTGSLFHAESHKARGYEIGKGQYLLIEDEELEAIEIAGTHTIDIDSFVPRAEIDQRFFDASYYIIPNDPVGQDAFAVIREVMRSKALVALGRVVLSRRERVIALEAFSWRRCGGASPRRRRDRQPHARLPPSRSANGRECQNLPHQCSGTAAAHSGCIGDPRPQFSSEEANHERSDRKAPALRRLHPQIDRA
jgi:hypothetical protein